MAKTSLITGASSGLGAEYARQMAARGDALVLVARDAQALEQLASELRRTHHIEVEIVTADLLSAEGIKSAVARLLDEARPVDVLVNNAGFGLSLAFETNDIEAEVRHLRLHNEVPMRLSHAALQGMLARRRGIIINVASVAAFIPRGTYSAVKRWLVDFSQWGNGKYRLRGVTFTAVCPGYTHTNFHERLGLPPGQEGVPKWMWLDAPKVVAESLRDAERGKPLSIPSFKYKAIVALTKIVPAKLAARAGERGR